MLKQLSLLFSISIVLISFATGQQTPIYTQYDLNKFLYNPAAAGSGGYTSISLIAREQWVGFKNTPKTHALAIDSRILGNSYILKKLSIRKKETEKTRSGKTGWGAYFYSDLNGPIDRTVVNGTYSYHIDLGSSQLSFGLSMVFSQLRIQENQFILSDNLPDDALTGSTQSVWVTDANFGIFYTSKDYFGGYSTMQILNSGAQFGNNGDGKYRVERVHNLMGGYKYLINNKIELSPTVLIKKPKSNTAQLDVSVKCTYDNMYWGGLTYRTGNAMAIFGGINIENYYFGYAFDYNFGAIHTSNFGTHEFIAIMRLGNARRYKWLNTY